MALLREPRASRASRSFPAPPLRGFRLGQPAVAAHRTMAARAAHGARAYLERHVSRLDAKIRLRLPVYHVVGVLARAMVVANFVDDAFRVAVDRTAQKLSLEMVGYKGAVPTILLALSFVAQVTGSLCVVVGVRPLLGCMLLTCWAVAQPFVYGTQAATGDRFLGPMLFAETLSLVGGLAMVASHVLITRSQRSELPRSLSGRRILWAARLGQLGRGAVVSLLFFHGLLHVLPTPSFQDDGKRTSLLALARLCTEVLLLAAACGAVLVAMLSRFLTLAMACAHFLWAVCVHPFWMPALVYANGSYSLDDVLEALGPSLGRFPMSAPLYASYERYLFCRHMAHAGALLVAFLHECSRTEAFRAGCGTALVAGTGPCSPRTFPAQPFPRPLSGILAVAKQQGAPVAMDQLFGKVEQVGNCVHNGVTWASPVACGTPPRHDQHHPIRLQVAAARSPQPPRWRPDPRRESSRSRCSPGQLWLAIWNSENFGRAYVWIPESCMPPMSTRAIYQLRETNACKYSRGKGPHLPRIRLALGLARAELRLVSDGHPARAAGQ